MGVNDMHCGDGYRYARRIKAFVLISSTYNVAYLITEGVESRPHGTPPALTVVTFFTERLLGSTDSEANFR